MATTIPINNITLAKLFYSRVNRLGTYQVMRYARPLATQSIADIMACRTGDLAKSRLFEKHSTPVPNGPTVGTKMKHQPTEAQKTQAKERRDRFRSIVKRIAAMPEADREALSKKVLAANVDGHVLSPHNQCLLAVQCPHVTIVGGFRQWREQGRTVRRGEHGHMIWVPITYGEPSDDTPQPSDMDGQEKKSGVGFIVGTVFDISQTEELGQEAERGAA